MKKGIIIGLGLAGATLGTAIILDIRRKRKKHVVMVQPKREEFKRLSVSTEFMDETLYDIYCYEILRKIGPDPEDEDQKPE